MKLHTTAIGLALLCSVPATSMARADAPEDDEARNAGWMEVKGTRFRAYGFPRVDAIFTDSRLAPNNQFPFFVVSEDPAVQSENDEEFDLHPRLTRLGFEIERGSIPRWKAARLSARIELDFQNGGSESREAVRMRHAYLASPEKTGSTATASVPTFSYAPRTGSHSSAKSGPAPLICTLPVRICRAICSACACSPDT